MRRAGTVSFRSRLFAAFLAATLIPVLLCAGALLGMFRTRLTQDAQEEAAGFLSAASTALDQADKGFARAAGIITADRVIIDALAGQTVDDTTVYAHLFDAIGEMRAYARFDLYTADGSWRYSTMGPPEELKISTSWGLLRQAGAGLVYSAVGESADSDKLLLRAASAVWDAGETVGYLVIGMDSGSFARLFDGKYGARNDLMVLSRYWRGIYASQPALCTELAALLRDKLLSGRALNEAGDDFFYYVAANTATGLSLVLRQPRTLTDGTMRLLHTVSAGCVIISILLSVLLSLRYSRQFSLPVHRLSQGMDQVEAGDLTVQVPVHGADELAKLTARFNTMVSALERNQEILIENQKELDLAQIRMLQAQLNPHFLCNTLDTMKWISKINRVPQVAEMSADLADILRFCISPEELVPLGRVSEILHRYVRIQQVRLSGGFSFTFSLPEELEDVLVPKMILQPLVENAVIHGLEGVENGQITVSASAADSMLVLCVADNGRGFPAGMLGPYHGEKQSRLGLYNVDAILRKYYGSGSGLVLSNGKGGTGAVISATLPIQREEALPC